MVTKTRRTASLAVAVPALTLLIAAPTAGAQESVTFASFGGITQEAEVKGLFGEAEKLGIKIRQERSGAWAGIKAHLLSGAPGWDFASTGFVRCEQATQAGLVQPMDYTIIDKSKAPAHLVHPTYLGFYTFAYGIAYQKSKYRNNPPKSWRDFWDVENFPGRRSIQAEGLYSFEIALMADGVPKDEVYKVLREPGGLDRAFASLARLKPHVAVWWRSTGQVVQLMRDGEVDMALFPNGRAKDLVADGADIGYVWNQGIIDVTCFVVPKNAANPRGVMKLLNSALDPHNQAKFATMVAYGPVNPKAFEVGILKEEDIAWLPTAPQNLPLQIYADQKWYASPAADAAFARYTKFIQE